MNYGYPALVDCNESPVSNNEQFRHNLVTIIFYLVSVAAVMQGCDSYSSNFCGYQLPWRQFELE